MLDILILQLAAVANDPPNPPPTLLWREFQIGMSPEQAAEKARSLEGVRDAKVKRSRNGKFKAVEIAYKEKGVTIGSDQMALSLTFSDEKLSEISLTDSACASAALEKIKTLRTSLTEKYGNYAPEHVIDENGVEIEKRGAFWNEKTRVRLSFRLMIPSVDYVPSSGGKTANAMSALANMLNQQAYAEAVKKCPQDNGATADYILTYSSQAQFLIEHEAELKARKAKAKATQDAL